MLAPAADKLGIDLIWFGVLSAPIFKRVLCIRLSDLRCFIYGGIAPKSIKTSDIYWGAIPWIGTMVILVAIVIFWPASVTYWIDKSTNIDPSKVKIEIQMPDMPAAQFRSHRSAKSCVCNPEIKNPGASAPGFCIRPTDQLRVFADHEAVICNSATWNH